MKKFTKCLIAICLMATVLISAVACATTGTAGKDDQGRFILAAPEISISGNTVTWKEVRYAKEYGVSVNDADDVVVKSTHYTLNTLEGENTVKVRALGDNAETVTGEYSKTVSYVAGNRLDTPKMPTVVKNDDNSRTVSWNAIDKAESYNIKMQRDNAASETFTSTTNELRIESEKFAELGIYSISVQAVSSQDKVLPSNFSDATQHYVTVRLATPKPVFDNGKISWEKVENAKSYKVFLMQGEVEKEIKTITGTSIDSSTLLDYIDLYNTDNDGNVGSTDGTYSVRIKAFHNEKPKVYLESTAGDVLNKDSEDIAILTKPAAPTNIQIVDGVMTWDVVGGYSNYIVTLTSGDYKYGGDGNLTLDDANGSCNLAEKINANEQGRVFKVSVKVKFDYTNNVLTGESAEYDGEFCKISTETLEESNKEGYEGYYMVNDISDLAYMIANPTNNYILTKDINGDDCNVYANGTVLTGKIEGQGYSIKNVNFVSYLGGTAVRLFTEIAENASVSNLKFENCAVDYEEKSLDVDLLAGINNGLIDSTFVVKSNIATLGNASALVGENNGQIINSGVVSTTVQGGKTTSGIARINNGTIYGITLTYNTISVVLPKPEKEEKSVVRDAGELLVGGVAVVNNGTIDSVVNRLTIISVNYNDTDNVTGIKVGGIVAINTGKITTAYMEGSNSKDKNIYIYINGVTGEEVSYVGGIVGYMDASSGSAIVDKTYVIKSSIDGSDYTGGIVGYIDNGTATVSNSYVASVNLNGDYGNNIVSFIYNESADVNTVRSNNYYRSYSTNAGIVGNGGDKITTSITDLVKEDKIDGYTTIDGLYAGYIVLENMIYADKYKLTNTTSSSVDDKNKAKVYMNGVEFTSGYQAASKSGNKLDLVTYRVGERNLVLAISNEIK